MFNMAPREILQPPYPPYIDMGTCPDCRLDWRMSRSEYTNWIQKRLPLGMTLPRRCPECRLVRRVAQQDFGERVRRQQTELGKKLSALALDIKEGVYDDKKFELALLLLGYAEELETIPATMRKQCLQPQSRGSGTSFKNATRSS